VTLPSAPCSSKCPIPRARTAREDDDDDDRIARPALFRNDDPRTTADDGAAARRGTTARRTPAAGAETQMTLAIVNDAMARNRRDEGRLTGAGADANAQIFLPLTC
jgi:hypothetical protein